MRRSRGRAQAVVEFGVVALLFTLLMFAVVDFGLLLNAWLTVASNTQQLARDAALGSSWSQLEARGRTLGVVGVSADNPPFPAYCCGPTDAIQITVTYYDHCTPGVGVCNTVSPNELDNRYESGGLPGTCSSTPCPHPSRPRQTCTGLPGPCPGDTVVVTMTAHGAQVLTPLVRPFFTNPSTCPTGGQRCYVPISSTITMRYDGGQL
jgi:hypothetical protein